MGALCRPHRSNMTYAIPAHVSVAVCEGRPIFLDLKANRYFALSEGLGKAFLDGLNDESWLTDLSVAEALVRQGVLCRACESRPRPVPQIPRPTQSLLDAPLPPSGGLNHLRALATYVMARAELRIIPFEATIRRLHRRKQKQTTVSNTPVGEVVAAHSRLGRIVTVANRCLPRSIALMDILASRGVHPTFVIGVRLPFAAHCWVQTDDYLISDQALTVSDYTPILVV